MPFVCPYCRKPFERDEILFYKDPGAQNPVKRIAAGKSGQTAAQDTAVSDGSAAVAANSTDMVSQNVTDFSSMASPSQRRRSAFMNLVQKPQQEEAPAPAEEAAQSHEQAEEKQQARKLDLGIVIRDSVLDAKMEAFGAGKIFTCNRTTVFYGIKSKAEMMEHPVLGYGYIENPTENGIPDRLRIYDPKADNLADWPYATFPICPNCRCDLPVDYFSVPENHRHVVALAGCTSAGKTQYITVALQDMIQKQVNNLGLVRSFEPERCSAWFHKIFVEAFQSEEGIEATQTGYALFPLLFRVETRTDEIHYITFYDCAGEYATNPDYAINTTKFLDADTVMLMVDVAQMFNKKLNDKEQRSPMGYMEAINALKRNKLLDDSLQHFIVVLTKCDVLMGPEEDGTFNDNYVIHKCLKGTTIPSGVYVSDLSIHAELFNYNQVLLNANEIREIMSEKRMRDMEKVIIENLGVPQPYTFDLLAVSTYSRQVDGSFLKVKDFEGATFHRLVEPLLVAMHNWNMLPDDGTPPHMVNEPVEEEKPEKRHWWSIFCGGGKKKNA